MPPYSTTTYCLILLIFPLLSGCFSSITTPIDATIRAEATIPSGILANFQHLDSSSIVVTYQTEKWNFIVKEGLHIDLYDISLKLRWSITIPTDDDEYMRIISTGLIDQGVYVITQQSIPDNDSLTIIAHIYDLKNGSEVSQRTISHFEKESESIITPFQAQWSHDSSHIFLFREIIHMEDINLIKSITFEIFDFNSSFTLLTNHNKEIGMPPEVHSYYDIVRKGFIGLTLTNDNQFHFLSLPNDSTIRVNTIDPVSGDSSAVQLSCSQIKIFDKKLYCTASNIRYDSTGQLRIAAVVTNDSRWKSYLPPYLLTATLHPQHNAIERVAIADISYSDTDDLSTYGDFVTIRKNSSFLFLLNQRDVKNDHLVWNDGILILLDSNHSTIAIDRVHHFKPHRSSVIGDGNNFGCLLFNRSTQNMFDDDTIVLRWYDFNTGQVTQEIPLLATNRSLSPESVFFIGPGELICGLASSIDIQLLRLQYGPRLAPVIDPDAWIQEHGVTPPAQ